jgi:hypothetical protein
MCSSGISHRNFSCRADCVVERIYADIHLVEDELITRQLSEFYGFFLVRTGNRVGAFQQ